MGVNVNVIDIQVGLLMGSHLLSWLSERKLTLTGRVICFYYRFSAGDQSLRRGPRGKKKEILLQKSHFLQFVDNILKTVAFSAGSFYLPHLFESCIPILESPTATESKKKQKKPVALIFSNPLPTCPHSWLHAPTQPQKELHSFLVLDQWL